MSRIEDISKMNLAEIDSPYGDSTPVETESPAETENSGAENLPADQESAAAESVRPEEEAAGKPADQVEKMAEPSGTHYYIDAHIGKEELGAFVRSHLIKSPIMVMLGLIGTGMVVYSLVFNRSNLMVSLIYFAVAVIGFPIYQYNKVMKINLSNPIYKDVLHYMMDEWGFHLEAGGQAMDVEWKHFIRRKKYGNCYVLYTGKANAFLLPIKDMGNREEEIISFIDSHMGGV